MENSNKSSFHVFALRLTSSKPFKTFSPEACELNVFSFPFRLFEIEFAGFVMLADCEIYD
jgi:hypothetical protein